MGNWLWKTIYWLILLNIKLQSGTAARNCRYREKCSYINTCCLTCTDSKSTIRVMRFSTRKCHKLSTRLIQCHFNCEDRTCEIKRYLFRLWAVTSSFILEFWFSQQVIFKINRVIWYRVLTSRELRLQLKTGQRNNQHTSDENGCDVTSEESLKHVNRSPLVI